MNLLVAKQSREQDFPEPGVRVHAQACGLSSVQLSLFSLTSFFSLSSSCSPTVAAPASVISTHDSLSHQGQMMRSAVSDWITARLLSGVSRQVVSASSAELIRNQPPSIHLSTPSCSHTPSHHSPLIPMNHCIHVQVSQRVF